MSVTQAQGQLSAQVKLNKTKGTIIVPLVGVNLIDDFSGSLKTFVVKNNKVKTHTKVVLTANCMKDSNNVIIGSTTCYVNDIHKGTFTVSYLYNNISQGGNSVAGNNLKIHFIIE